MEAMQLWLSKVNEEPSSQKCLPLEVPVVQSNSFEPILTKNRRPRLTVLVWDVKEPTHCSERVGDDVPGVMAYHLF